MVFGIVPAQLGVFLSHSMHMKIRYAAESCPRSPPYPLCSHGRLQPMSTFFNKGLAKTRKTATTVPCTHPKISWPLAPTIHFFLMPVVLPRSAAYWNRVFVVPRNWHFSWTFPWTFAVPTAWTWVWLSSAYFLKLLQKKDFPDPATMKELAVCWTRDRRVRWVRMGPI